MLMPGVISHPTNLVEQTRLVADRILRYAAIVGRENIGAGTDCGLGGRVHADLASAKLRTLVKAPASRRGLSGPSCACYSLATNSGSGCRMCLVRCERCRIQFAVSLLDSSGAEMALHCDADMVRTIVGASHVKLLSGPTGSQCQDALA